MKKFQKTKENFLCGNCDREVIGNGYTNHCPDCLWSKHVDINPGDRSHDCHGLMKPISYEKKGEKILITHRCQKCHIDKKNKILKEDNFDELLSG